MKVVVLCGGSGFERGVSLRSGQVATESLRRRGIDARMVDVVEADDESLELELAGEDAVIVLVHGRGGEDGALHRQLERIGITCAGSSASSLALTFDKAATKSVLAQAEIPTAPWYTFTREDARNPASRAALMNQADELGWPLFVKPATGGSALGVRMVYAPEELPPAIVSALAHDDVVIIESLVRGHEVSIGVWGPPDQLECLPVVRIRPRNAGWFDHESRYEHGEVDFICPPDDLTEKEIDECRRVALASCNATGVSGLARVDLIMDSDSTPYVLEINGIPGMTPTSIIPFACRAGGLDVADAFMKLLPPGDPGQ